VAANRNSGFHRTTLDLLFQSAAAGDPQFDAKAMMQFLTTPSLQHFASSHDDTSQGAVHVFQDEHGHPMTYVFDDKVN